MILKIDSTKEEICVQLVDEKGKKDALKIKQKLGSQVLLPAIVTILKKNKTKLQELSAIEVNKGPGSFTGTRVGVSIANALGFALNIPVNGSPCEAGFAGEAGKIVVPKYEKSKFDNFE